MSQVPVNRDDPRKRYTHQAYDVTYLGMPLETGPAGYGRRLSATYQASILLQADAGITAAQPLGTLTRGVWAHEIVNHVALSTGTAALVLPAYNGLGAVTLAAALPLNAAAKVALDAPIWVPLSEDRPLEVTITSGTATETAIMSLLVTPAENGWY